VQEQEWRTASPGAWSLIAIARGRGLFAHRALSASRPIAAVVGRGDHEPVEETGRLDLVSVVRINAAAKFLDRPLCDHRFF
jgi:hypothetical protein